MRAYVRVSRFFFFAGKKVDETGKANGKESFAENTAFHFDNSTTVVMTVDGSVFFLCGSLCIRKQCIYKTVLSISNHRRVPHVNGSVIRREIDESCRRIDDIGCDIGVRLDGSKIQPSIKLD